ncbi:Tyrosine/nicotianamine aminotransferase [Trema orientale]|uniref:Tyrosine/nicotianamine aminotransferase n=1 Tax=Trema orientale TaxID=63057 RepID=A0A2P5DNG9_TREOI|nr:Tyrosine/nicotianamine aminotransferase [Trema orientale]
MDTINGSDHPKHWKFEGNKDLDAAAISVRGVLNMLWQNLSPNDERPTIVLGCGDPTQFPSYRTNPASVEAVADALLSFEFNSYPPTVGVPQARRAIAKYLSNDLISSYKLSEDDVYLTVGCTQAIDVTISVLARPGANILLPRPGYPQYAARAAQEKLEVRHFDLVPEKGWEVDLDSVEALADNNTAAIVIVNPSNPCGSVYKYQHLKKIAETARRLGILVIADEVYGHLVLGSNPFVPMAEFASLVPVLTLGSISKRWIVPGWRLGWLVTNDPNGILKKTGIVESIKNCLDITCDPATFIQGAVPQILEKSNEEFFSNIRNIMREAAEILYERLKAIPGLTCPQKPEGSMVVMVKLNLQLLEDIVDDVDFCLKLAREESVIFLPGVAVGLKNWIRITFAAELSSLDDALGRLRAFCKRHAKKP